MRKIWLFLGIVVFMISATGAGIYAQERKQGRKENYVVGKIGKEKVYISEIEKVVQNLNQFLRENFEKSKSWRLNYIRNYIAQIALAKRAVNEGLDKDKEIIKEMKQVKRSVLAEKMVQDAIDKELKVTEENLKEYYEKNKAQYRTNEESKISYVKLNSEKKAQRIISLLEKGRSFERAAGKEAVVGPWISKDVYVAPEFREFLPPEIVNKIAVLEKGANSGIMEIKEEFYIFYINDKQPAKDKPFEEVRNQVESQYTAKEKERIITGLILETFEQEKVEIYGDKAILGVQP